MKKLSVQEFARFFDHTNLKPNSTEADIRKLCSEAKEIGAATVCVNSYWIPLVAQELKSSEVLPIGVVGFPLGAMATDAKVYETKWSIEHGAKEIDMVINIGELLAGKMDRLCGDIEGVIEAAGDIPVKVIIETAYLDTKQIQDVTRWCATLGAAFVKTSTGFAPRGATVDDIKTIAATLKDVAGREIPQIKASGGIRTMEDALKMIEAGAHRIGASATVAMVHEYAGRN